MITETPFPHSMVRTLSQNVSNEMHAINDKIADLSDLIERDEYLSRLILLQGSLSLLTLATIREDHFFLQRAVDLLRS
jgi:hypothetical protein